MFALLMKQAEGPKVCGRKDFGFNCLEFGWCFRADLDALGAAFQ